MLLAPVVRRSQPCLLRAIGARGVATEKEMRKKIATTTDIEKITSRFAFWMSNKYLCPALLILVKKKKKSNPTTFLRV